MAVSLYLLLTKIELWQYVITIQERDLNYVKGIFRESIDILLHTMQIWTIILLPDFRLSQ